jgi:hypothetical protein
VAVIAGHEELARDREIDRPAEPDDRTLDRRDAVALLRKGLAFKQPSLHAEVIDVRGELAELAAPDVLPDDPPTLAT